MESMIEIMPHLAAYYPAFVGLIFLCLIVLTQGFLAGAFGLGGGEEVAGMPLQGNHTKLSFRLLRTYGNSTENFSVMVTTTFLAILAGVSVVLVNWLVGLHLLCRLIYWCVYYSGVGKVAGGLRTIVYVGGLLANIVLALAAAYTIML